jgi:hypothetical protein
VNSFLYSPESNIPVSIGRFRFFGTGLFAVRTGLHRYPEYIKPNSSDADVQLYLYSESGLDPNPCTLPCGVELCHDETEDDECHGHVVWAKDHGVATHPEWQVTNICPIQPLILYFFWSLLLLDHPAIRIID